MKERLDNYLSR